MYAKELTGTKRQIFDAAVELFYKRSYANVPMSQIAEAAGIRTSSIYNHFSSKDALLEYMYGYFQHHARQYYPSLENLYAYLEDHSVADTLKQMIFYFPTEIQDTMHHILIISAFNMTDMRARILLDSVLYHHPVRYTTALIKRMIERDRIKPLDVESVAQVYACICHSTTLQMMWEPTHNRELWAEITEFYFQFIEEKHPA